MNPSIHAHTIGEKKAMQSRLRKIAGQIAAIETMISDERDCTDVLTQVVSVRKALKSFAEVVIHEHAHKCIEGTLEPREAQKKLKDLLVVLQRYVE